MIARTSKSFRCEDFWTVTLRWSVWIETMKKAKTFDPEFADAKKLRKELVEEVKRTGKCLSCKKNAATVDLWCSDCMDQIKNMIRDLVKS